MAVTHEENRKILLTNETSGEMTSTDTMATGASTYLSRPMIEDSDSTTERTLFIECADDDVSTPTIEVSISLYFGGAWSDYESIDTATAVARDIKITSYNKSWWIRNKGVRFKLTKVGSGAVTFTGARWV